MLDKKKIVSVLMYFVAAVLFCSYLIILVRSLDSSNASDEYRMFYKEHTLAFYLHDDGLKEEYCSGTEAVYLPDGKYRNLGEGWGPLGPNGIWTLDDNSTFYFYVDDTSANQVITINCIDNVGYNNRLYVNGNPVGDIIFQDGVASLEISNTFLVEGINVFLIHTDDDVLPICELRSETESQYAVNMLIYSIKLEAES